MSEGIITRRASDIRPLLLDRFRNAAAAYSLRPLTLSGQDNPVVKVRRDSDDAEQDFSPAEINDGSLLTFVGNTASDNGFVTTWYDQSGNGNDATQSTAASQPKIVDAGSLVVENGKAALDFDGSNDFVHGNTFSLPMSFFCIGKSRLSSGNSNFISGTNSVGVDGYKIRMNAQNDRIFVEGQSAIVGSQSANDALFILSAFVTSSNLTTHINGAESVNDDGSRQMTTQSIKRIGSDRGNSEWDGVIQEIIAYDSDQSSSRQQIESNINNHYGIY